MGYLALLYIFLPAALADGAPAAAAKLPFLRKWNAAIGFG